jgi:hypothetical protein
MKPHQIMAVAALWLCGGGGCHTVLLGPVIVTPAPAVATPAVALEVTRVGLSVNECADVVDVCKRAHLAVGVEAVNHGDQPVTLAVDAATLAVGDGSVGVRASGVGPLIGEIDDRSDAGEVIVGPGDRRELWVDFTNLPTAEADRGVRSRVALAIPVEARGTPGQAELVLADPARTTPRWHRESPISLSSWLGGVWMHVPVPATAGFARTERDIFGVQFGMSGSRGRWFARYSGTYAWLTRGNESDSGVSLGAQIGKTFSLVTGRGGWLSWAPTAGVELGYYYEQPPAGQPQVWSGLVGLSAGVSLFSDRDRAFGGPLPIEPLHPRHGSMTAIQLLYVHWFGEVTGVPLGWTSAGFMMNLSMGLNSP